MNEPLTTRRFHAFCLGTSKSGTHSIAGLFQPFYRAAHEAEYAPLIQCLMAAKDEKSKAAAQRSYFQQRDERLGLEMEASNLLSFFAEWLLHSFPQAKFILTLRDCYSWLDSYLNHQLNHPTTNAPHWQAYRDFCFARHTFTHSPPAAILAHHHLYPLDGYLSYWQQINQTILRTIPPERRLILRTYEIAQQLETIATFLAIPAESLNPSQTHLYQAPNSFGLLRLIERDFLEEKVHLYCQPMMENYFPEIETLEQALDCRGVPICE